MLKVTFCVKRLPHLSRKEFNQYWYEKHGPLVRKHAAALRMQRYVQVPILDRPKTQERLRASRGANVVEYDGVAEVWWKSFEDLVEASRTPEGARANEIMFEDEKRFIDLPKSAIWYGVEREIFSLL